MAVKANTGRSTKNCQRYPDGVWCPFCGSYDTKFKFLNNKKVDQPRYLCSNCKRFWTEGGRIRGMNSFQGTGEVRSPASADTTPANTTSAGTTSAHTTSQPSVSAVSTPTPTASNGSSMGSELPGGISNTLDSPWNALLEVAKLYRERDFPDSQ